MLQNKKKFISNKSLTFIIINHKLPNKKRTLKGKEP